MAALDLGVPPRWAFRKKIPLNEGGTGIKNCDCDPDEWASARTFLSSREAGIVAEENLSQLVRLGIVQNCSKIDFDFVNSNHSGIAFFRAAQNAGLNRMLGHNQIFRNSMPDTIYSTEGSVKGKQGMIDIDLGLSKEGQ